MGLFSKNDDKNFSIKFSHFDGIPNYTKGFVVKVTLDDDLQCITFKPLVEKRDSVKLRYEQIKDVLLTTDKEIVEKSKSVAGRAILGGVLLGGVGAIFGGMSGIGNKKQTKVRNFVAINYKSDREDEIKSILLEIVGASMKWDKFITTLKEKAQIKEIKNEYL